MEKSNLNNLLQLKGVEKHFGGVRAVDGCDLAVEKGKITALIGPNGAGKSTIFNLISGILKPNKGEIFFGQQSITDKSIEQVSNLGVSRLLQHSHIFENLTIEQNLNLAVNGMDTNFWDSFFGNSKPDKTKSAYALTLLDRFALSEKKEVTANELSYGQRRLVELIRAIVNPHELLILDEPVAGIAPSLRKTVGEVLREQASSGDTILLIEHDMAFTFEVASKVTVMDKGRIIADGTPDTIRGDLKVLDAYLT